MVFSITLTQETGVSSKTMKFESKTSSYSIQHLRHLCPLTRNPSQDLNPVESILDEDCFLIYLQQYINFIHKLY